MVKLFTSIQETIKMALQQSELTPVELESFADESKRACLFYAMKNYRMMAEKVKLSTAEHPGVQACFRCETVLRLEIHLHYHQNICLCNLTNSNTLKKRQLTLQTFEYEARKSIKDDFYKDFFTLKQKKDCCERKIYNIAS